MISIGPLSSSAWATTWLLVMMWPLSSSTNPEPVAPWSLPSYSATIWTVLGSTFWATAATLWLSAGSGAACRFCTLMTSLVPDAAVGADEQRADRAAGEAEDQREQRRRRGSARREAWPAAGAPARPAAAVVRPGSHGARVGHGAAGTAPAAGWAAGTTPGARSRRGRGRFPTRRRSRAPDPGSGSCVAHAIYLDLRAHTGNRLVSAAGGVDRPGRRPGRSPRTLAGEVASATSPRPVGPPVTASRAERAGAHGAAPDHDHRGTATERRCARCRRTSAHAALASTSYSEPSSRSDGLPRGGLESVPSCRLVQPSCSTRRRQPGQASTCDQARSSSAGGELAVDERGGLGADVTAQRQHHRTCPAMPSAGPRRPGRRSGCARRWGRGGPAPCGAGRGRGGCASGRCPA